MTPLYYVSTNGLAEKVDFGQALLNGIAPDKGLYMPNAIPRLTSDLLNQFTELSYADIAFHVLHAFLGDEVPDARLRSMTQDAYTFDVPLEQVDGQRWIMRLDQGPTASFKDFAARMMARLMQYYLESRQQNLLILTATSGDTGSAIANAFYGLDRINVLVLYPKGEVSDRQRRQMTTLGDNIKTVEVAGKFDDCQALVKSAFVDPDLTGLSLTSANSINIGRLIPQSVYYCYAWSRLKSQGADEGIVFSVPSGNFGDMMGGLLAMNMGVPVRRLIVAVNANDEFPRFMTEGRYEKVQPSRNCLSSAMNVGHPSNLSRVIHLYGGQMNEEGGISRMPDLEAMKSILWTCSIDDAVTEATMVEAWKQYGLLLEPHGSVGWAALNRYRRENDSGRVPQVVLETAHPAKFPERVESLLNTEIPLPDSLSGLADKPEYFDCIDAQYNAFKAYLIEQYS